MRAKVVFVHGFMGGNSTWGRFPELLKDDLDIDCEVSEYGFSTLYWPIFGKSTSVQNLAEGLLTEIKARLDFEHDEIILIGHSLGGLVIRQMLLNLELKGTKHKIRKIAFFAVPQDGSGFANLAEYLPIKCHKLKALCKDGSFIESLNDQWCYANLTDKFEIMSVVGGKDLAVTSNSSKSIFRHHQVEMNIDAGHSSIVKPKNKNDLSFLLLKKFIESTRGVDKYTNLASENYRDWLAHDNGRRHGYSFVSDSARSNDLTSLYEALESAGSIVRLTGLSGLGKSRLILEYINGENEVSEDDILVFNASSHEDEIRTDVKRAIKDEAFGLIIIEHCSIDLHDYLAVELVNNQSQLRIITVNFYDEKVDSSPYIHLSKLDDGSVSELIKPMLPQFDDSQLKQIVTFVEGFPLLAILIAERFREEGVLSPELTERDFADKLINADGNLTEEHKRILQACSLFDVFGVEAEAVEQADYIINLAKSDRAAFGQVLNQFEQRKIINRVGRFARVVPKPLAVHLASMWWDNNIHDELENLINTLPESLIGSFCTQVKYLDSSEKVCEFVNRLCEPCGPFGQAELLLSTKGSRLFRALVEVNPNATSNLLFRIINNLTGNEISNIKGDVRRNFVWSLEMLVFHESCFSKASWCLFKLAQHENENYGNNATGQFTQLFRWQLSGTEANFEQRLLVLNRALRLNTEQGDLVVIEAIKTAIDTHGGSRTVGAEYQGTKPELTEWRPKVWLEIFDYWRSLFEILINLVEKQHLVGVVKDVVGHEIRGLIRCGQIDMLNEAIHKIVAATGKYWPAAAQSITHALHYDAKEMTAEKISALHRWEELLAPDPENLEEKLKLIVLNPSREHERDEDGHYIDVAAEEAKVLAQELKDRHSELFPYLDLLLNFPEQKQSWVFAKELVLGSDTSDDLLSVLLAYLRTNKKLNTQFLSGFLVGLSNKYPEIWEKTIELFGFDEKLQSYYPDAIRTGLFKEKHLATFIELIEKEILPSYSASTLVFGRATEHLTEEEIAQFCMSLSKLGAIASWVALDNINMYTHGRKDYDYDILKPVLIHLVLSVSFRKEDKSQHLDGYHWLKSVEQLLATEGADFAVSLCDNLVKQVANNDVDYSDLWDYLHPAFYQAIETHGASIWPVISEEFINNEGIKKYRLVELLGSGKESRNKSNSIFTLLNETLVIDWCKAEDALKLVARTLSMFDKTKDGKVVNSLLIQLIANYGDNKAFLSELSANFYSRSWCGSLIPSLESDKTLILPLKDNQNFLVSSWAIDFCNKIDKAIEAEAKREAEDSMLRGQ